MISFDQWLLFLSVTFVVSASPGPLMLLTMFNGINYGYSRSLPGMLGASCGNLILVAITALGISLLLNYADSAITFIKWFGVLYLFYLGCKSLFVRHAPGLSTAHYSGAAGPRNIFLKSFLVSISNPKGLVYFAALFPQFIEISKPLPLQFLILTITFLATDFLWMSVYAKGGHLFAQWLSTRGHRDGLQRLSGFLLVVAAVLLAVVE